MEGGGRSQQSPDEGVVTPLTVLPSITPLSQQTFFPRHIFHQRTTWTAGGSVSVTAEGTVSCSLCSVEELITCSIGGFFKGEKWGKKTNKPWSLCSACRDTVLLSHLQEFSAGAHNNQDRYETREEEEEDDEDGYCFWVHSIAHLEKEHLVHAVRGQWRL